MSQKAYDRIVRRLERMERRQLDYGYDVLGLALAWLGIAHQRRNKFVCSQFVAQTLQEAGALELPDHPSLVRPEDFADLEPLRVVYQGPLARAGRVGRRAMAA